MEGNTSTNPFLSGNYAPVRAEDDFELRILGEIPRELRGSLFRIGANPQFDPRDPAGHHWFSAMAWSTSSLSRTAELPTEIATSERRNGSSSTKLVGRFLEGSTRARRTLGAR